MDIAALSMINSQTQVMNDISISVLAKTLDSAEITGDGLIRMMESSVNPNIGSGIDVSV